MRVLLTGSYGFVGNYFLQKYKRKFTIDTFSFQKDNFTKLNLADTDVVIHLSALVHQMGGADRQEYERVNVEQTVKLAIKAKKSGVKHFIFMSSVKVYGEETSKPYKQSSACNPQDEYGKSKLKAEKELQKLENSDFTISIIRTPIVYGYGVKANIKSLINLVKKVPILPFGSINNKRSMIYIGNLCYALNIIVNKKVGGIFLVSDDEPVSTTELIELISKALNKKIYLIRIPFFKDFLRLIKPSFYKRLYESLEVDSAQTKKILGIKNPYNTELGIKLTIEGEE